MPIGIVKPEMLNNKTNFGYEETPEFQPFEFYSPQRFYSSLKYTEDEKKTHLQSCLAAY